jgi:hypothetical protein
VIRDILRDITIGEAVFALLAAAVVVLAAWEFCVTYIAAFS